MLPAEISIQQMPPATGDAVNGNLLMLVSEQSFAYAVVTAAGTLGVYEKFSFANSADADLPALITGLPWMRKRYNQVKTAWFTREATLVPAALYKMDTARHHLGLLYGDLGHTRGLADFISGENAYCVYRVPQNLLKPVVRNFPVGGSWHTLSLLLGDAPGQAGGEQMRLHFMQDACCVALYRDGRLMAGKAIGFAHYMDVVYSLLGLCRMYSFDPETMHTAVSGDISAGAPLYDELRKYLRYIEFSQTGFTVPAQDQSCPPHFFYLFHLLNRAL